MGFWRSFYLNIFLVISTLTLGTFSLSAEEKSSFQEEKITVNSNVNKGKLTKRNASLASQNQLNSKQNTSSESEEEPLDFSDTGRSGQQTAGETRRGQCPDVPFPLTALVPSSNSGKTIAAHPKLWFYVPYSTKDINKIEFVIQDANRNDISRQTWQPKNIPGYLSASLPATEPALETSKSYRWYFKVYCQTRAFSPFEDKPNGGLSHLRGIISSNGACPRMGENLRGVARQDDGNSAPLFVQGWIDKIEVSQDLPCKGEQEKSLHMIYANKNLWFDAIDSLLTLLNSYSIAPNNAEIRTDWDKLIKAKGVDLELPTLETTDLFVRQKKGGHCPPFF